MNWLNRAEARFPFLAIPGLPLIIVGFNLLTYILLKLDPNFIRWLVMDWGLVMHGEVWRLVTFVFIPSWGGWLPEVLAIVFYLVYLYIIGSGLEQAMGAFRFTLYYALGMLGVILASYTAGSAFGNGLLNSSLFFAFARFFPDRVFYIAYVLPVKVKWMAWFFAAVLLLQFLGGGWGFRITTLATLANYLLFFGRDIALEARHRQQVTSRRAKFDRDVRSNTSETMHDCAVCHRTERSTPDLEFRVARDGQEYCLDHLPPPPAKG